MEKKAFTILNVDDSKEYLSTHSHILKKEGYDVLEAVNGNDCMVMVEECKPDMILLNVVLPDTNGVEICRQIKNDPATKHILVLLISALEIENSAQVLGLDSGADGYLLKPISKQALLAHVRVMERIKRNEDELREVATMLEKRVKERTEKLRNINKKLQNEISERRQIEQALRESEEKYRLIAEKTTDVIWLMNLKGESIYVSPSVEKFTGYTVQEYLKQSFDDRLTHESAQIAKERLSRELAYVGKKYDELKDYILKIELEYKCKDGTTKWGELLITPYFDNQEKLSGIHGVTRNITERKRIEEALKENERQLSSIYDTVGDVIFHLTVEADGMYRFNSVNHAFCQVTGLKEEMVVGKLVNEVIPEPSLTMVLEKYRQAIKENSIVRWEEISEYPNGRLVGDVSIAPVIDDKGRCTYLVGSVHDITERKYAENALRESEIKYRDMVEQINDVIFSTDTNGVFTYISPTVEILGGYKPEEMIGHFMGEFLDPLFIPKIKEQFRKVMTGNLEPTEYRVKTKLGEYRWVRSSSRPILKENKTVGMRGVLTEVSERKQAEVLLKQSEAQYRLLADHMKDTIWLMDMNLKTTYISPSVEKLRGYSLEELQHLPLNQQFTPASFQLAMDAFSEEIPKVMADPAYYISRNLELEFYRKDGTTYWSENRFSLIRDENGIPISIMGEGRNITERKRVEEALRESELRFRSLYENTTIGLYRTTPDGKVLLANPALLRMLGYTSFQDLAERNLEQNNFEPSYQRKEFLEKIERDGEVNGFESKWILQDGTSIFVLESARAIRDAQGKTLYYDGTVEDITKRKLLEEQMKQMQKLEGLGTLAGGIAHDFNNILGIILAYITSIEKSKGDAKKLGLATETITKAVQRGKTLVQQILTFARKTETAFGAVDVNDVVMEIMAMIYETFPKVLTYEKHIDKEIRFISADRSQLYQALLNLCVNARDAMPKGGVLTINTRMVSVADLRHQHPDADASRYVCMEVSDTGEGMTQEIRSRIFDPFFTTKEQGKGTGLGLAVVFGVVQTHKGYIDVESELGKGTTFRLYLPASQIVGSISEKDEETLEEISGGTETLLVVEDEEMLMMSLQMALGEKGYKVISAGDGQTALKIYEEKKNNIALVLTDLGLPTMTGMEVCQRIKKINLNAHIIVATGYLDPDMKSELLKAGIQHFLYKPYDLKKVLKVVREVLDQK